MRTGLVAENEKRVGFEIELHLRANDHAQPVDVFPKVHGIAVDIQILEIKNRPHRLCAKRAETNSAAQVASGKSERGCLCPAGGPDDEAVGPVGKTLGGWIWTKAGGGCFSGARFFLCFENPSLTLYVEKVAGFSPWRRQYSTLLPRKSSAVKTCPFQNASPGG